MVITRVLWVITKMFREGLSCQVVAKGLQVVLIWLLCVLGGY